MSRFLTDTVSHWGLAAVFLLMLVESCGIPFPSEVIMPVAGGFAAAGHLNIVAAIFLGAAGNLAGSLIAYGLAAAYGPRLLLGPGRWVGISQSHLDSAHAWFARYGLAAVFTGRLLPVVRTYISFPAGLARVPPAPFAALTFAGALPWCAALAAAGYAVGASYTRFSDPMGKAAIVIAVLVAIAVVAWVVRGRHRRAAAG